MALGLLLVVVYRRAAVRGVAAALSALLLACCYRVACGLLLLAVRWWHAVIRWPWHWWQWRWPIVALLVALAWPAGGGGRAGGRFTAAQFSKALLFIALQHGTATLPGGTYRGRPEIFWAEFQF